MADEAVLTSLTSLRSTFADFPLLVGRQFLGDWFTVEPSKRADFARAVDLGLPSLCAGPSTYPADMLGGFHLLAMLDHMVNGVLTIDGNGVYAWNYGTNRVRFLSPVRAGERFRIRGSVAAVTPRNDRYLVELTCLFETEAGRGAMAAHSLALWSESRAHGG